MTAARAGWAAAGLVALATVLALAQAPAVLTDSAWGLLAALQHEAGRTPDSFTLVEAAADDLDRDRLRRVSMWAPAYQGVPVAFRRLGLTWPDAVRATTLAAWAIGAVAWVLWFRAALADRRLWPWLVAAFLAFRPSHQATHAYPGGENLEMAALPVAALCALWALGRHGVGGLAAAGLAGAAAGALFGVRYGALLVGLGLGAAWAWEAWRRRLAWSAVLAFGGGLGLMLAAWRLAGIPGGPTALGPADGPAPGWAMAWPFLIWPLALSDLDAPLRFWLFRPGQPLPFHEAGLQWIGLAALSGLGGLWWLTRPARLAGGDAEAGGPARGRAARLAAGALLVTAAGLAVLYARGANVSFEGRHMRLPALLLLPFVVECLVAGARSRRPLARAAGLTGLALLVVLPAVYGLGALWDKTWRRAPALAHLVGPLGLRLDLLAPVTDARAFYRELETLAPGDGVLYVVHPSLAFDLARRRTLVVFADTMRPEFLASLRYRGAPAGGVALVLPAGFEASGKRAAIQASFVDLRAWTSTTPASAPAWRVWRGTP